MRGIIAECELYQVPGLGPTLHLVAGHVDPSQLPALPALYTALQDTDRD
jgi:hypothetical protein